jgi:hypothetical protein
MQASDIIAYPPWLIYRRDIVRLAEYAQRHRLADSAVAIRHLLDRALSESGDPDAGR